MSVDYENTAAIAVTVRRKRENGHLSRYRQRSVFSQGSSSGFGARLTQMLLILILLVGVGGAVYLGLWDLPAPTQTVEKVIPNDRFAR